MDTKILTKLPSPRQLGDLPEGGYFRLFSGSNEGSSNQVFMVLEDLDSSHKRKTLCANLETHRTYRMDDKTQIIELAPVGTMEFEIIEYK
ncbi:hypothetical protein [Vibrio phage RYC]|nr:hypothetical protein [Vibrio phage RYC]